MSDVLYDVPGPRARARNMVLNAIAVVLVLLAGWYVYSRFAQDPPGPATSQWDAQKWKPFVQADVWRYFLVPGIAATLKAAAVAGALAMVFGVVFAVGRLSALRPLAWLCAAVIEFFRAVPLLLLMVFLWLAPTTLLDQPANVFAAVVCALMLYNGSVIAEVIRAGVQSLPRGQREASLSIGLTSSQTMRLVLLPQALRAMLPAIIAQLVVLLKDGALGYWIGYGELLRQGTLLANSYGNIIPAMIVTATIFIVINVVLGRLATWVEHRTRRRGHTAAEVRDVDVVPPAAGTSVAK